MCTGLLLPGYRGTISTTLTEAFPCFFLSLKQMPRYNSQRRGKTRTSQIFSFYCYVFFSFYCYVCSVLCVLCTVCVWMCTVLLPPGVNPIAVKSKCIYNIYELSTSLAVRLILRKQNWYRLWRRLGGPQRQSVRVWRRENFLPQWRFNLQPSRLWHVVHRLKV
jgi:magnesium-transporting ATPase (P-type)